MDTSFIVSIQHVLKHNCAFAISIRCWDEKHHAGQSECICFIVNWYCMHPPINVQVTKNRLKFYVVSHIPYNK